MSSILLASKITLEQNKLTSTQNSLKNSEETLKELKIAQSELESIKNQYESEIRVNSSPPNQLLGIKHENLTGVDKIKDDVKDVFSGNKEKSLVAGVEATFEILSKKIAEEELRVTNYQISIANLSSSISILKWSLRQKLAEEAQSW